MADVMAQHFRRLRKLRKRGDVAGLLRELQSREQSPGGVLSVRREAARHLGDLAAKEAVKPLTRLLGDETEEARISAAIALGKIGDREAIPALLHVLADPVSLVRERTIMALGEIGDPAAIPHLMPLLHSESKWIRMAAIYALSLIEDEDAKRAAGVQLRRESVFRRRVIRRNLRKYRRRQK